MAIILKKTEIKNITANTRLVEVITNKLERIASKAKMFNNKFFIK